MSTIKISHLSDPNGKNNEDSCTAIPYGDRAVLCIADGIGGLDAGEIASAYLTMYVEEWAKDKDFNEMGRVTTLRELQGLIMKLHDDLLAIGEERRCHLGSTFVIAVVGITRVIICSVGDSRAYMRRDNSVKQVTKDQTVAEYERETGNIVDTLPQERKEHTLCEWLGYGKDAPVLQTYEYDINEAADILLCTDGLSNTLTEDDIYAQLKKRQSGDRALASLVKLAKSRGETDNITAVLFRRRATRNTSKKQGKTGTGELKR